MVSVPRPVVARSKAEKAPVLEERAAHLNARFSAYLIDSAVLFVFLLVSLIAAGSILLAKSNAGGRDAPDSAYYAFMAVLLGGSAIGWTVFNIALSAWRGQSVGKYLVGIRVARENDRGGRFRPAIVRWFGLSPLCFHPLLLPLWSLFAIFAVFLTLSQVLLIVMLAILFIWIISPAAALITMLVDPSRRALHDRLAGTIVVHTNDRDR